MSRCSHETQRNTYTHTGMHTCCDIARCAQLMVLIWHALCCVHPEKRPLRGRAALSMRRQQTTKSYTHSHTHTPTVTSFNRIMLPNVDKRTQYMHFAKSHSAPNNNNNKRCRSHARFRRVHFGPRKCPFNAAGDLRRFVFASSDTHMLVHTEPDMLIDWRTSQHAQQQPHTMRLLLTCADCRHS